MNEDVIFAQGHVTVTKTLVRIGGTSYPVNGIGSVLVEPRQISWKAVIAGIIAGLIGLSLLGQRDGAAPGIGLIAVAVACLAYAFT